MAILAKAYSPAVPAPAKDPIKELRSVFDAFKLEFNFVKSNFPVLTFTAFYK